MTTNTSAELFSPMQITRLHAEYRKIDRIDPCSEAYGKLIDTLNAMSRPQLQQVHDAKIKFLGRLALNRL